MKILRRLISVFCVGSYPRNDTRNDVRWCGGRIRMETPFHGSSGESRGRSDVLEKTEDDVFHSTKLLSVSNAFLKHIVKICLRRCEG